MAGWARRGRCQRRSGQAAPGRCGAGLGEGGLDCSSTGDIYAGGCLRPSASPDAITVANPATEEIMGAAPAASDKDVDIAVRAAREAFDSGPWPRADRAERA